MPAPTPGFSVLSEGSIAMAAAGTAKSMLSAIAGSGKILLINEVCISLDGVTAANAAILFELCRSTQAGTGTSTSATLRQVRGNPSFTFSASGAKNFTAEPTVLVPVREWLLDPYKLVFPYQLPLGREVESPAGGAIVLRATVVSGTGPNFRGYMEGEE